jgi:ubiquinone/menaquinone biosynthesis C-methylase UbiE
VNPRATLGQNSHLTASLSKKGINVLAVEELEYWDSVGATWWKLDDQALWRGHSDAVNLSLLERWLSKARVRRLLKTDVFDEAFGKGLYPMLALKARHVINMDISMSILEQARIRYPKLQGVKADVRCLPYADRAFDIVVSNSTLDHFTSRDQIFESLRELNRALAPNGQLVITMDNLANPAVWLRNALPFRWLNALGVLPYYVGATCGPRRLRRYLKKAGFEIIETTAILHCPRVLAVALARYLNRGGDKQTQRSFLRFISGFEWLERWPTRYLTGYFVAVLAAKRESHASSYNRANIGR